MKNVLRSLVFTISIPSAVCIGMQQHPNQLERQQAQQLLQQQVWQHQQHQALLQQHVPHQQQYYVQQQQQLVYQQQTQAQQQHAQQQQPQHQAYAYQQHLLQQQHAARAQQQQQHLAHAQQQQFLYQQQQRVQQQHAAQQPHFLPQPRDPQIQPRQPAPHKQAKQRETIRQMLSELVDDYVSETYYDPNNRNRQPAPLMPRPARPQPEHNEREQHHVATLQEEPRKARRIKEDEEEQQSDDQPVQLRRDLVKELADATHTIADALTGIRQDLQINLGKQVEGTNHVGNGIGRIGAVMADNYVGRKGEKKDAQTSPKLEGSDKNKAARVVALTMMRDQATSAIPFNAANVSEQLRASRNQQSTTKEQPAKKGEVSFSKEPPSQFEANRIIQQTDFLLRPSSVYSSSSTANSSRPTPASLHTPVGRPDVDLSKFFGPKE